MVPLHCHCYTTEVEICFALQRERRAKDMTLPQRKHPAYTEKEGQHLSQSHARYKAYFFGSFRITLDERPLGEPAWRRNKAKALLKWFLLNPSELFSLEQLSKLFWPDIAREVAASNVHVTLHYLRHVLEPQAGPWSSIDFYSPHPA